ncbi:hypothetical protein FNW52_20275 [Flavobacterium sp. ZT3R18]|uniref:hypothetical protein n=1 Tax=Flavobacterium sp. ZT3R18 TaxID=2594429 RepID=UPI001179FA74|nr:hypothetical protein [Flavobacterium sp. ZT3R18]TRX30282.1 hypothetical protein FNW52_20275 [Flavobacterium sp. ZT3R18]
MKNRVEILELALILEKITSAFLAELLDIENYKETRSLGNKSGNLSFNQKVELLIDIRALSKNDKNKYQAFMELRNQFMHNLDADTYEKCYNLMEGKEKFVLKIYPQPEDMTREEQLRRASLDMANDIIRITSNLIEVVKEKIGKQVTLEMLQKSQDSAFKAIKEIEDTLNAFIDKKIEQKEKIEVEGLKNLGTEIRKLIYGVWGHHFKNGSH